ncbi:MAG: FadR/GntR family transcriptional regulator [Parvibaculaceae bacterium]
MAETRRRQPDKGSLRKSLYNKVAHDLGQRIVRGDFKPGALLPNEAECGQIYKVSRTAVREAVKMLSAKGLIQSRPKIGSRIEPRAAWNMLDRDVLGWYCATVDFQEFAQDVQQIRFMIEPEAAALAAIHRTQAQLAEIDTAYRGMAAGVDDEAAWNVADVKFHLAVLDASGNDFISPFGRVIESLLANLFSGTVGYVRNRVRVLPLHEAILDAIRARKPDAARRAVRRLLETTQRTIERGGKTKPAPQAKARQRRARKSMTNSVA